MNRWINRYGAIPWLSLALALLGYTGWQSPHLLELLAWQIGAIAVAPPLALALWTWIMNGRKLDSLSGDERRAGDWQNVVLTTAVMLAIALGI